jgi:predicted HNH restriction endonuclease
VNPLSSIANDFTEQIRFKDPNQEWHLVNAWFVKQNNFQAMFERRDIVQPDANVATTQPEST